MRRPQSAQVRRLHSGQGSRQRPASARLHGRGGHAPPEDLNSNGSEGLSETARVLEFEESDSHATANNDSTVNSTAAASAAAAAAAAEHRAALGRQLCVAGIPGVVVAQ